MANFEEAKQFLMKESNGTNLYEHISEALLKIIVERPSEAYNLFEHISTNVKTSTFVSSTAIEGAGLPGEQAASAAKTAQLKWAATVDALSTPAAEDAPESEGKKGQDLQEEGNMLECAGVGFGREETYRLQLALKQLSIQEEKAKDLRFWGKISGTVSDYYIAEAELEDDFEPTEEQKNTMEGKEGANKYTYWVCSYPGGEWTQLPNVTSAQILAARKIKKFFTGKLNTKVTGYPPFPGDESCLLRAQIARISSATTIIPAGFFTQGDDEEKITMEPVIEEEEIPDRNLEEMLDLSSWEHLYLEVNSYGRCTKMPPKLDAEGEEIVDENEPEQKPALRPVAEDEGAENIWKARAVGKYAVLRNLEWPGAYAVAQGRKYVNVYTGYGCVYSPTPYTPPAPPQLQSEYVVAEDAEEDPSGATTLVEQPDVLTDPTPPGEEEDEGEQE